MPLFPHRVWRWSSAGVGKPKAEEGAHLHKLKKKHKKLAETRSNVDDDYLAGPLTVDTYTTYRMRPVMEMLERRANKLSWRLSAIEIAGFTIQSSGAVLATFKFTEWVALTVAISAVLQGFIEFMSLRDQLTSVNLALKDLESLSVMWDSLSIVRRRTTATKLHVCMRQPSFEPSSCGHNCVPASASVYCSR